MFRAVERFLWNLDTHRRMSREDVDLGPSHNLLNITELNLVHIQNFVAIKSGPKCLFRRMFRGVSP